MRKDTVDGDAVALELKGQDTGEGHNSGFGVGVGSDVRCGDGRVIGDHFDAVRGGTAHRAQHSDQRQAYSLDDGGPVLLPHVQADVAWHPARCRRAPRRVATMCPPSQRDTGVVGVGVIHCTQ